MSRRTPTRRPRPAKNASWMPLISLAILIVIGGLAIGALISKVFSHREDGPVVAVVPSPSVTQATSAPHAQRPVIVATIVPRITPSPVPTPTDIPSSSPAPSPTGTPRALASAAPTSPSSDRPPPSERPSAAPTPLPTPSATPLRKRTPAPPATLPPEARTPAPVSSAQSLGAVPATPALGVVRRYIDALKRGDEVGAYAALGGLPGDRGLSLSEESFVDRNARITSVRSTSSEDGSATVEIEIASAKGTYFSTFHVIQNAKGFVIDQHDFIKP